MNSQAVPFQQTLDKLSQRVLRTMTLSAFLSIRIAVAHAKSALNKRSRLSKFCTAINSRLSSVNNGRAGASTFNHSVSRVTRLIRLRRVFLAPRIDAVPTDVTAMTGDRSCVVFLGRHNNIHEKHPSINRRTGADHVHGQWAQSSPKSKKTVHGCCLHMKYCYIAKL